MHVLSLSNFTFSEFYSLSKLISFQHHNCEVGNNQSCTNETLFSNDNCLSPVISRNPRQCPLRQRPGYNFEPCWYSILKSELYIFHTHLIRIDQSDFF